MTTKAIRIHAYGGPEVMHWEDVPTPEPGPGEALVRHEAVGLNYIDIYFRTGLYKTTLPTVLGMEGAGTVMAIGDGVAIVKPGDRVAYAGGPLGAYASDRVIAADRLVKLPAAIDSKTAAAMMLQGMTAQYLLRRTHEVKAGETIVVHAAAGGVGLIMCQWAKHLGATVIGVVSTPQKAELARQNGAAHTLVGYANLAAEVKRITGGAMVPVVYDSVGKDTLEASLKSLKRRGLLVSFGTASGPVRDFDFLQLALHGSLFLTRPALADYIADPAERAELAGELFGHVAAGRIKIEVNQHYALEQAVEAHRDLEGRRTTGSSVFVV
jgi:NADPH2:quinone reductase